MLKAKKRRDYKRNFIRFNSDFNLIERHFQEK